MAMNDWVSCPPSRKNRLILVANLLLLQQDYEEEELHGEWSRWLSGSFMLSRLQLLQLLVLPASSPIMLRFY